MERVPENRQRGHAIVAHPDDLEYGAASAIVRWTGQGKSVVYCTSKWAIRGQVRGSR